MNYRRQYRLLILKHGSPKKPIDCYTECHHIKPRCMGGTDVQKNKVFLTARCHYLAHWLLWKIHRTREMALAFKRMCEAPINSKRPRATSRQYENARRALSQSMLGKKRPDIEGKFNPMKRPEIAAKIAESKKLYWKERREREGRLQIGAGVYDITSPSGEVSRITNLKQWCEEMHINYASMLYSYKAKRLSKRTKGYTCVKVTT